MSRIVEGVWVAGTDRGGGCDRAKKQDTKPATPEASADAMQLD